MGGLAHSAVVTLVVTLQVRHRHASLQDLLDQRTAPSADGARRVDDQVSTALGAAALVWALMVIAWRRAVGHAGCCVARGAPAARSSGGARGGAAAASPAGVAGRGAQVRVLAVEQALRLFAWPEHWDREQRLDLLEAAGLRQPGKPSARSAATFPPPPKTVTTASTPTPTRRRTPLAAAQQAGDEQRPEPRTG